MMRLFTFAHKKEAHAFIKEMDFIHLPFIFDGLFKNDSDYLLITGEGIQPTTEKLTSVLASFNKDINEVINLGVAGSLSSKYPKDTIVKIRTSYAHHAERLEFKSFTTKTDEAIVDCMSVHERALDINIRKNLAMHADIIDRELWAIGSVSHLFKIPFQSFKYISDDLDSLEFCKLVIENSEKISYQLFHFYDELNLSCNSIINSKLSDADPILISKYFYFTATHKRKYLSTLEQLQIKNITANQIFNSEEIQKIINSDILPKERTKALIEFMTNSLNPFHNRILNAINNQISSLKKQNIDVGFDRNFEENYLHFSFKVKSQEDLNLKIKGIKDFDYQKIDKIFNGELDGDQNV